ncbi:MAG: helix-turn-helix transcriptional regulator [Anaerolineae bacterium]|nr:helix-turn-helix transcriptional regulator [Anaerolineae bacterium]
MLTPILSTKLYIPPPRPNAVPRPRLIGRLNAGLHRKLTLVSAPAGFGKTTLVSVWIGACGRQAAWLSLDDADNDTMRLLLHVIAALRTIDASIGERMLNMLPSIQPTADSTLTVLINDLAATPHKFVLVLDDYHTLNSRSIDAAIAFLIEHMPPNMHLVIATRTDPHLPLARLRARDQLTELRAADLRFNAAESVEFLQQVAGLHLAAEAVNTLEKRTEGWIAGLQLAALAMQGQPDAHRFIDAFAGDHPFVLDYLVEEVLQNQPAHIQTFMLRTSILERLCAPLCDALINDLALSGQEALDYLERANLFLIPLDDRHEWVRYHHLFAEALHARLLKQQPDLVRSLHLSASLWYGQHNAPEDAIQHALAGHDYPRAADLLEQHWSYLNLTYFQSPRWLGWVKALPDELVRGRFALNVGYAWELLNVGNLDAAETRLQDAERWLQTHPIHDSPEFLSLRAQLSSARAYHAQARGDFPTAVHHARHVLEIVADTDDFTRAGAASVLGLSYWATGDLEGAYQFIAEGMANFHRAGNPSFGISPTFALADIRHTQGRLHDALGAYERSLQIVRDHGEPVLQGATDLYLGMSLLYDEMGDGENARLYRQRGETLGEQAAFPGWKIRHALAQAQLQAGAGHFDAALSLLDTAERLHYSSPLPDMRPIPAQRARLWIKQGKLQHALTWADERGLTSDGVLSYLSEYEYITLVRLLIALEQHDDALRLSDRLLAAAHDRIASIIELLNLQALVHHARGDTAAALVPLERALSLAADGGFYRIFLDEGATMRNLLVMARGIMPEYVDRLLATQSVQPLIDPLSPRELDVLRLIADGLSNQAIGDRLFLALSTVKGYVANIFGKLHVERRTEAVARARELGLL